MAKFKVGDIVVGKNHVVDVQYNGREGTLITLPEFHAWIDRHTGEIGEGVVYRIHWEGELNESVVDEYHIELKKPPASDKGEESVRELFDTDYTSFPQSLLEELLIEETA